MNFCPECGKQILKDAVFCVSCGHNLVSEAPTEEISSSSQSSVDKGLEYTWIGVGVAVIIGIPAMQSAIGMPSQAEYVTFDFTLNHLLYGGWYVWYSGDSAIMAKYVTGGGMDASNLRLILWFISGFAIAFAIPQVKAWFRR